MQPTPCSIESGHNIRRPLSQCTDAEKKSRESVYLRASIADSARSALTTQADLMAQQVAELMRTRMGGSAESLANGDGVVGTGSEPAELFVIAHPDGSVQRYAKSLTGDTTGTTRLMSGFDAARANGDALFVWPDDYHADSIVLRLTLRSLPVTHEGSLMVQYQAHPAFGVFLISEYTFAPALAKPNNPTPQYPFMEQLRHVGAGLMLEFVVDTSGRVVPGTIRDLWPPDKPKLKNELLRYYEGFVDASETAVASWKFYPARKGTCHVPQIVQLPIQYSFRKQ